MEGKTLVIEPLEPIADKDFGAFKIETWPEDLDEFVNKEMRKWWTQKPRERGVPRSYIESVMLYL